MPDRFLYLAIDLCCLGVPLMASFHPRIPFYKEWKSSLPAISITAILFILWDIYFTHKGVWQFNTRYILGFYIANLPIEEVLFFFFIPYACLFIYYCVEKILIPRSRKLVNGLTLLAAVALAITALLKTTLWYTSTTFFVLGILLLTARGVCKKFLPDFLIAFLVSLIPFFIANGVLTGSWIGEPVVRYNDAYNLGVRVMTIPVEDIAYGMAFQLSNLIIFDHFRSGKKRESAVNATVFIR